MEPGGTSRSQFEIHLFFYRGQPSREKLSSVWLAKAKQFERWRACVGVYVRDQLALVCTRVRLSPMNVAIFAHQDVQKR
jgi:hypothetical protein